MSGEADKPSPQEMRARLERSYRDSYRRAGIRVSAVDVGRQVLADLQLVDAARAAGELGTGRHAATVEREKPQQIIDAEHETGMHLRGENEQGVTVRHRFTHSNPLLVSERWGAACARIIRIVQGAGAAATFGAAAANAEMPALAREFTETYWYFVTKDRPPVPGKVDHNPFRGRDDHEAARMLMRKVEDICDRSTGVLGSWFVK